jgi:hypothetical protein
MGGNILDVLNEVSEEKSRFQGAAAHICPEHWVLL